MEYLSLLLPRGSVILILNPAGSHFASIGVNK